MTRDAFKLAPVTGLEPVPATAGGAPLVAATDVLADSLEPYGADPLEPFPRGSRVCVLTCRTSDGTPVRADGTVLGAPGGAWSRYRVALDRACPVWVERADLVAWTPDAGALDAATRARLADLDAADRADASWLAEHVALVDLAPGTVPALVADLEP